MVRVARGDASNLARRDALTAMSRLDRDKARPWLLKALKWRSWRHVIAGEALMLLAKAADVRDVKHIWKAAKPGNPPGLRQWALTALAAYAIRTPAAREVVREEIERALHDAGVTSDIAQAANVLAGEGRDHALRVQLEQQEITRLDALDVPVLQLPYVPGGIDLSSLYELASVLSDQGASS